MSWRIDAEREALIRLVAAHACAVDSAVAELRELMQLRGWQDPRIPTGEAPPTHREWAGWTQLFAAEACQRAMGAHEQALDDTDGLISSLRAVEERWRWYRDRALECTTAALPLFEEVTEP